MSTPGAATSTLGAAVENDVTWSLSAVAATVNTCGHEAGYVVGLPDSPSFPAAATTRQPLWNAVRIASWSSGSGVLPPKLRLIPRGSALASNSWSVALG